MTSSIDANCGIHQLSGNCYQPSDSDDDDSFVVLNTSLGPDVAKDSVYGTEPIQTESIQSNLESVSSILAKSNVDKVISITDGMQACSMSSQVGPEDIQRGVDEIIHENTKLKDTLAQNNLTMRKQVERLTEWQSDVQRVQESHKQKFAEMKQMIEFLKNENSQLKQAKLLDDRRAEDSKLLMTENVLTKSTDKYELEAARFKITELEKALDVMCLYKEEIEKVHLAKAKYLDSKVDKLQLQVEELSAEIVTKTQTCEKINNLYLDACDAKGNADKEICSLKLQLETLTKTNEDLSQAANKINTTIVESLTATNTNLTAEKSRAEKEVIDLKMQIQLLEKNNEDLEKKFIATKNEYDVHQKKLMNEISALKVENANAQNFQETLDNIRQQLMASQMHITELKQQHTAEVKEKDDIINEWKVKVQNLHIAQDEFEALKTQADLYKSDFELERHSKIEIVAEKNKILDDLQQVYRHNEQLRGELEILRSGFVDVRKETTPPQNSGFSCPRCNFTFDSYQSLENHVYRCIELDMLP